MYKKLQLSGLKAAGSQVLLDTTDYTTYKKFKWHLNGDGYAARTIDKEYLEGKRIQTMVLLHRLINQTPDGLDTDHINGDKLDNRRQNLRTATRSQNLMNTGLSSRNTSGYKNITWDKEKLTWRVQVRAGGKSNIIGRFNDLENAIQARDEATVKLHGKFARTQ